MVPDLEHIQDPYPFYARLRQDDPVHWDAEANVWVLTRYADVAAALRDPRLGSNRLGSLQEFEAAEPLLPLFRALGDMMLFSDAPKHTRLRALMADLFGPAMIDGLRPFTERLVTALLDRACQAEMELIGDFGYPLPTLVLMALFGIPADDREQFRAWWTDVAAFLGNLPGTPESAEGAVASVRALQDYLARRLEAERTHPGANLLTVLAQVPEGSCSREELLANCILLLSAGQESTTNLIGNGALAMLRHPDQRALVAERPALAPRAVEEVLRFDSPVQFTGRRVLLDLEIAGRKVREGEFVLLVLGAANRDPAQFSDPDLFHVERPDCRHVAFGAGAHFCLGAPLGRLIAQCALPLLARRFADCHLDEAALEWKPNPALRALNALRVVAVQPAVS